MYAQIKKPKENNNRAVANSIAQKKSKVKESFRFVNSRSEGVTQRALLETPAIIQLKSKPKMTSRIQVKNSEMPANTVLQRASITLDEGESVGKVVYTADTEMKGQWETYKGIVLVDISVPKGERNNGYGGRLMTKFMTEVVGGKPCYLDVISHNDGEGLSDKELVAWYEKYGFISLGKSGWGDNIIMGINVPKPSWEERGMGVDPSMKDYLSKLIK